MKRSAHLWRDQGWELGPKGVTVAGYDKKGKFVCRLWINSAGLAVYAGTKGRKKLANVTWEKLVERLSGK